MQCYVTAHNIMQYYVFGLLLANIMQYYAIAMRLFNKLGLPLHNLLLLPGYYFTGYLIIGPPPKRSTGLVCTAALLVGRAAPMQHTQLPHAPAKITPAPAGAFCRQGGKPARLTPQCTPHSTSIHNALLSLERRSCRDGVLPRGALRLQLRST